MEYYVLLKNMEILSHATAWMDVKDIMQSEINLPQKDRHYMILLIWHVESSQNRRNGKWNGGCQGLTEGKEELVCSVGSAFQCCHRESSGDLLHNNGNVLSTP